MPVKPDRPRDPLPPSRTFSAVVANPTTGSSQCYGLKICSRPSTFLNVSELALPFAPSCTYVSFVPAALSTRSRKE